MVGFANGTQEETSKIPAQFGVVEGDVGLSLTKSSHDIRCLLASSGGDGIAWALLGCGDTAAVAYRISTNNLLAAQCNILDLYSILFLATFGI